MKICRDKNGNDNTATASQILTSRRQLQLVDLYAIGPPSVTSPSALAWVGNQSYPVQSQYLSNPVFDANGNFLRPAFRAPGSANPGTFIPLYTKRSSIDYRIGVEVSELQLEIGTLDYTAPAKGTANVASTYQLTHENYALVRASNNAVFLSFKQALACRDFDGWPFWYFRGIMPTPGDVDTIGVVQMFFGWLASYEITRSKITLKIQSPLAAFVAPYPSQTIEPGDRTFSFRGKTQAQYFPTPTTGTTTSVVVATGGVNLVPNDLLDDGWLVYGYSGVFPVANMKFVRRIRRNVQIGGLNYFYLYQPLPVQPLLTGDNLALYAPSSLDSVGSTHPGFPYVPKPEQTF